MNDEPWIGDVSDSRPGTCDFAMVLGMPKCGAPATRHICAESAIHGLVSMATCDAHAPYARAAGLLVAEHPYTVDCSARETYFHDNYCTPTTDQETPA